MDGFSSLSRLSLVIVLLRIRCHRRSHSGVRAPVRHSAVTTTGRARSRGVFIESTSVARCQPLSFPWNGRRLPLARLWECGAHPRADAHKRPARGISIGARCEDLRLEGQRIHRRGKCPWGHSSTSGARLSITSPMPTRNRRRGALSAKGKRERGGGSIKLAGGGRETPAGQDKLGVLGEPVTGTDHRRELISISAGD